MTWPRTLVRGAPFALCAGVLLLVWYPLRTPQVSSLAAVWSRSHDVVVALLLAAAVPAFIRVSRTRGPWFRDLPLLYLALCMISVIPLVGVPTLGISYARMQWVTLATFAATYLCSYAVARWEPNVVVGLAAVWCSWGITSAVRTVVAAAAQGRLAHDFVDPMGHANSRAGFELGAMLVVLGVVWKGHRTFRKLGLPILLLFLTSVGLSLSRGAWFGLAVAVAVGVAERWGWKRAALALAVCGALVAVVPGPVGQRARSVADASFATNLFRLKIWGATLQLISENPWGGVGYDTMWFAMLSQLGSDLSTLAGKHVHNLLLQTWAETGLLGALALIGVFVALLRLGWVGRRDRRPWIGPLAWGFVLAMVGMIVHNLVDCTWRDYGQQVVFWSMVGWLFATAQQGQATG